MSFLHPALLAAGLACVTLPIVIHFLFRRRRKPVQWGAMRFLLEAYRRQRRRLRLEQLLLLAARCLLVALIAVGLGRPLLQRAGLLGDGALTMYLLVDNSVASSARDASGESALDGHKKRAEALLSTLDAARGDRAGLIALGSPADPIVIPSSAEISAVSRAVAELQPTAGAMDLDGALTRLAGELEQRDEEAGPVRVVVLSDFLAGSADTDRTLASLGSVRDVAMVASMPAATGVDNIAIVGAEPLRPVLVAGDQRIVRQQQVTVRLRRSGPGATSAGVSRVRIFQQRPGEDGGALVGEAQVDWPAGETTREVPISVSVVGESDAGVLVAQVDRDAIEADDVFRRPIEVRTSLRVGVAARRRLGVSSERVPFDGADWVAMALSPDADASASGIEVSRVEPAALDASRLSAMDALVVVDPDAMDRAGWARLSKFTGDGGLVIVFPPADVTTHAWTDDMLEAMDLGWTIARETEEKEDGASISNERGPFDAGTDLLRLLTGEMEALTSPVTVWRRLSVRAPSDTGVTLLSFEDGAPMLVAAVPGSASEEDEPAARRGLVVLCTVAPSFEWTDLPARPLIVPLLQETVRQGLGEAGGPSWGVAGRPILAPARATELEAASGDGRLGVGRAGQVSDPVRDAGIWLARDDRGAARGIVAVNADTDASVGDAQTQGEVGAWLAHATPGASVTWMGEEGGRAGAGPGAGIRADEASTGLAAKLLLAALLVGVVELVMGRFFSHARLGDAKEGAA